MLNDFLTLLFFILILTLSVRPLGIYLYRVFETGCLPLCRFGKGGEARLLKFLGIRLQSSGSSKTYMYDLLVFSLWILVTSFLILFYQHLLPWADGYAPIRFDTALNAAISTITGTNWQSYDPAVTLSRFSIIFEEMVAMFFAPAIGICVCLVLVRSLSQVEKIEVGNFYLDFYRAVMFVLLPLSIIWAVLFIALGTPQSWVDVLHFTDHAGQAGSVRLGPIAAFESIKLLGSNGAGIFASNAAHPFENPHPATNFLHLLAMLLIPAALTRYFGQMVGAVKQGWVLYSVMLAGILFSVLMIYASEVGWLGSAYDLIGGNMAGKETRFGVMGSALYSALTVGTSTGSLNLSHEMLTPLSLMTVFFNMVTGEVFFGGVGMGFVSILIYAFLAVFLSGLMVGRSPEYIGKRIEPNEMIKVVLYLLVLPGFVLIGAAYWVIFDAATILPQPSSHATSEVLYALLSTNLNNGSSLSGVLSDSASVNYLTALMMICGRYIPIILAFMLAATLTMKKIVPVSSGTFPTDSSLFAVILMSVIILMGALTFIPVLVLGPVLEHLLWVY